MSEGLPSGDPTFFERAGGEPGIRAAVTALYEQLFDDVFVGFLFAGHDRTRIIEQQIAFTSRMLGADVAYTGKPLPEAHQSSPILPGHFDRRHHLLRTTLLAQGMEATARDAWLRLDAALRPVILKQGQIRIEELRRVRLLHQLPPQSRQRKRTQAHRERTQAEGERIQANASSTRAKASRTRAKASGTRAKASRTRAKGERTQPKQAEGERPQANERSRPLKGRFFVEAAAR